MSADSTCHRRRRQPGISAGPWARRVAATGLWLLLLCHGCRSIYEQTLPAVGVSPGERFQLRFEEARQMRERADRAAARVEKHLRQGDPASEWGPDIDRLQVATMDLSRALAAVEETFSANQPSQAQVKELHQLRGHLAHLRHLLARARPPPPP